jgi:hypothetical protein
MKIKSALATSISGSIGGLTGSHNRGGLYLRARRVPTNPNTNYQITARSNLASISSAWGSLTDAQRTAWNLYASNVPVINALGDSIFLSGQQWYVKCNTVRMLAGQAIEDDGPTTFALADLTQPTFTDAATGPELLTIGFNAGDQWAQESGGGLNVQVSRPQGPGITFFRGPWRYVDTIDGNPSAPTSPETMTPSYTITAGQKLWIRCVAFRADGRISAPVILGPKTVT